MNLLAQLHITLNQNERGIAKITGQKADGSWLAQTRTGAVLVLTSDVANLSIGKQVYYQKRSNRIVAIAPDVAFKDYAV
ncbi:hypothetical protein [Acinetobacter sp. c3-l95]|uniref:hypothetical protein n=1 Tax=Acinetobacter sp. c3-l95 TaxID=3342804 RepID=UPI0035BB76EF